MQLNSYNQGFLLLLKQGEKCANTFLVIYLEGTVYYLGITSIV